MTYDYIFNTLVKARIITGSYIFVPDSLYEPSLFLARMIILFVAFITTYLIVIHGRFILPFLLTLPFVESVLYYGLIPSYLAFFTYLSFLLILFVHNRVRKMPGGKTSIGLPVFACIIIILSFGSSLLLLQSMDYKRPQQWSIARNSLIDGTWPKMLPIPQVGGINGGWVLTAGNKQNAYKTALKVTMPIETQTLYLKGFVGGEYTGSRWKSIPDSAYKANADLFQSEASENISLQELFSYQNNENETYNKSTITVETFLANKKYAYLPYSFYPNSKFELKNDTFMKPPNKDKYTFQYGTNVAGDSPYKFEHTESEYEALSTSYHEFVLNNYLDLPNMDWSFLEQDIGYIKAMAFNTRIDLPDMVAQYLGESAEYTLTPGTTPTNQNFIEYFLKINRQGYCVHFATAGTVILRKLGIPARYVEGYIVTNADINRGRKTKEKDILEVTVLDTNAHAWVEYYDIDRGWIPLEVTPGYHTENNSAILDEIPNPNKKPSPPSEDSTRIEDLEQTSKQPDATTQAPPPTDLKKPGNITNKEAISPLHFFFIIIAFVGGAILIIMLRVQWILYKRNHSFVTKDNNLNAIALYHYWKSLVTYDSHLAKMPDDIFALIQKAMYSQHNLSFHEVDLIKIYVFSQRLSLYQSSTGVKKLIYQYIYVL